jgi:hypothetical protein
MRPKSIAVVFTAFALVIPGLVSAESVMSEIDAANKAFAKAIMAPEPAKSWMDSGHLPADLAG